jgi:hypothetical protein
MGKPAGANGVSTIEMAPGDGDAAAPRIPTLSQEQSEVKRWKHGGHAEPGHVSDEAMREHAEDLSPTPMSGTEARSLRTGNDGRQ